MQQPERSIRVLLVDDEVEFLESTARALSRRGFTVTVADEEAPTFAVLPTDLTVGADAGSCGALVSWVAPTANDNCAIAGLEASIPSGSFFPLGTTTVNFSASRGAIRCHIACDCGKPCNSSSAGPEPPLRR